jgi:hypothetical protein
MNMLTKTLENKGLTGQVIHVRLLPQQQLKYTNPINAVSA